MFKIIVLSIITILLLMTGCSDDEVIVVRPYDYYYNLGLDKYKMLAHDYYNPITNTFKNDTSGSIDDTAKQKIETYYDDNDTLRYIVFKGKKFDILGDILYNDSGDIKIIMFDTVIPYVRSGTHTSYQCYQYKDGKVIGVRDKLRDNFFMVEGDSATVLHGIYRDTNEFEVGRIYVPNYYIR